MLKNILLVSLDLSNLKLPFIINVMSTVWRFKSIETTYHFNIIILHPYVIQRTLNPRYGFIQFSVSHYLHIGMHASPSKKLKCLSVHLVTNTSRANETIITIFIRLSIKRPNRLSSAH